MADNINVGVNLLKTAAKTVQERGETYGSPRENMARTAALWSVLLKMEISPTQVAMCMIAVKQARLVETPNHEDSVIDIAGWAAVLRECQEE